jgi:hypothetical protein
MPGEYAVSVPGPRFVAPWVCRQPGDQHDQEISYVEESNATSSASVFEDRTFGWWCRGDGANDHP